jgi:hypothetical protein
VRRWIASLRRWWRQRSEVTLTFPPDHPITAVIASAAPGTYSLSIGDRTYVVRARWWDTPASIARKMRRALRRGGVR